MIHYTSSAAAMCAILQNSTHSKHKKHKIACCSCDLVLLHLHEQGYLDTKRSRMDHILDGSFCYWDHDGEPLHASAAALSNGGMGLPDGYIKGKGIAPMTIDIDSSSDEEDDEVGANGSSSSSSSSGQRAPQGQQQQQRRQQQHGVRGIDVRKQ